jgi:hypothetical protein
MTCLIVAWTLIAVWLLLQTPGSIGDTFSHPLDALAGTGNLLNAKLLEVSESGDAVRAAGQRLLQPLGVVRLIRIYDSSDSKSVKKP